MSLNDSSNNEKFYRFISDPGHKETLSGRVHAACVTCRRKKIKCSGDVPCATCEEKGLLCEGIIQRKRPKKNPDQCSRPSSAQGERGSSQDARSDDSAVPSKRSSFDSTPNKVEHNEDIRRRPTAHLRGLGTANSYDSGYASSPSSKQDSTASQPPLPEPRFPFSYNLSPSDNSRYGSIPEISPSTSAPKDWNFSVRPPSTSFPTTAIAGPDIAQSGRTVSAAMTTKPFGWPDPGHKSNLWENGRISSQTATNLIAAAEALEKRALSLRRLASRGETELAGETRRQTITFPIYPEVTVPQTLGADPVPAPYNDPALMLEESTFASGLTPILQNFSPWWDINPELPYTLEYPPSTNNASAASPTDSRWPYISGSYDVQSTTVASEEQTNELTSPHAPSPDTRQSERSNRHRPQNPNGWLYPWPE